jgi:hypothetical protein
MCGFGKVIRKITKIAQQQAFAFEKLLHPAQAPDLAEHYYQALVVEIYPLGVVLFPSR